VEFTRPTIDRVIVGVYFIVIYVWLAAPMMTDLWHRFVALAGEAWRAITREPWRV
jgi:hypothetical protein